MYSVTETFEISYAHRLLNHKGKCARLHGHNGIVKITLSSSALDAMGMVMDFSDLKAAAKGWLESELDHKTVLNQHDPLIKTLQSGGETPTAIKGNPTAENFAELIYTNIKKAGLPVTEVEFYEDSGSKASYKAS